MSRMLPYAQLLRVPNVFTAMSDIFAAFLIANGPVFMEGPLSDIGLFLLLLAASSSIYMAGIALNDAFDVEIDREERPNRPVPSGRISRRAAFLLGGCLLATGVGLGWAAGRTSGTVASVLAGCVLLYDAGAKQTFAGPVVMGVCRMLNMLLGMSTVPGAIWWPGADGWNQPFAARLGTLAALGLGMYVLSVTRFARREAAGGLRVELLSSLVGMNLGLLLLGFLVICPGLRDGSEISTNGPFWIVATFGRPGRRIGLDLLDDAALWILTAIVINVAGLRAIVRPTPAAMQRAIKVFILSIVLIDASVVFMINGPAWSLAVLALLPPAVFLGKWVYST